MKIESHTLTTVSCNCTVSRNVSFSPELSTQITVPKFTACYMLLRFTHMAKRDSKMKIMILNQCYRIFGRICYVLCSSWTPTMQSRTMTTLIIFTTYARTCQHEIRWTPTISDSNYNYGIQLLPFSAAKPKILAHQLLCVLLRLTLRIVFYFVGPHKFANM